MTDQQFLGVNSLSDKTEIKNALIKKISDLDFEIDIELILKFVHCSQRLIQKKDHLVENDEAVYSEEYWDLIKDLNTEEGFDTPEKLINHFNALYENVSTRFNYSLWKSAIESLKWDDSIKLNDYVKPVIDFLKNNPYLKSDVLILLADRFPFGHFFSRARNEENKEFWQQYGFVHKLLEIGNFDFDLHADVLNNGQFTSSQLDDFFARLMNSSYYYRNGLYPQAFNSLAEGIPADAKPLLFWHRELNILYKAVFVEKIENITDLFKNTLNSALISFPQDEQLLYMRAKFIFQLYKPEVFKKEIITTLKIIPNHEKCLFLLGKCYMKLGIPRAALIIFENLKKISPINMRYVTSAAVASRQYIDFCINEHDPNDNDKQYYIKMIDTLIEKGMFDEAAVFAAGAPKGDGDIEALLLYSEDVEGYLLTGKKDKDKLMEALSRTTDKEIVRKIKQHYLKDFPNWSDIKAEKDFITDYYKSYPNDSMANYQMGMFYFAESDIENAYEYFVKAKEIDPDNIDIYFNLARVTSMLQLHSEAIEYIKIYLQYNKYNVIANEVYCDCTYSLRDYYSAHKNAKWLLSICRRNEFDPKYFFYFTTSLSYYMDKTENKYYNLEYIISALEIFDQYPKPATFWTNDNGSRSMYWAATICYKTGHYVKAVEYLECIFVNVREYNWDLMEKCKFELLPQCLYELQQHENLIQSLEIPTQEVLKSKLYDPSVGSSSFYISHAYGMLGNNIDRMQWALTSVKCHMKMVNPSIDWVENYILNNFEACLELQMEDYIILFGEAYLDFIRLPNNNHIWITHTIANRYLAAGQKDTALQYHKSCLEFGKIVSMDYQEIRDSEDFINSFNQSIL
ncbi:hypothetical protein [Flavobacterium piscis]|uniref:Tetratricopeptide (TPR) repeat protein n=1 Tax=Flavobacterium piscis TaxID=1114874 RepID=A0ABU1YCT8_9FLAO|nr:hypothetical protein [Flavobacterium piscis]MDR7212063.1 tetratricopeptide (TPR) repeat protein [Flavobacterium piscis]